MDQNDSEKIEIFLHVHHPQSEDKSYYSIDQEKNLFYLHDPIIKNMSDKTAIFELNKIFTNENKNSYIYSEISGNTIKEALNGFSFVFISYGITVSDKINTLIGNVDESYSNTSQQGIFPLMLKDLIENIDENKEYKDNLSIYLSHIGVYGSKLIDFSNFIDKDFPNFTGDDIIKNSITINGPDDINQVKKIPIEDYNDCYFFMNKIIRQLKKLEEDSDSNYHLYSRIYLSNIIYINNNEGKNISSLNFIVLNGSELLLHSKNKDSFSNFKAKKNNLLAEQSKISLDTQFTYDSIIYAIKNNKYISGYQRKDSSKNLSDEDLNQKEKSNLSKLTKILYIPSFERKKQNIKYRIIGNILPLTGFYQSVKNTLMFLFGFYKIINDNNKRKCSYISDPYLNKSKNKNQQMASNTSVNSNFKNDVIFDLEKKLKIQERNIEDLNRVIDVKIAKISSLENHYKKQIEVLKKYLGFNGDENILISGNEYTKEWKNAQSIRDAKEQNGKLKIKIEDLENKLANANQVIQKLSNIKKIKEEDKTMLKYFLSAKEMNDKNMSEAKHKNVYYTKLDEYEKEIKIKNKIINELYKDLETKNKAIISFTKYFKNNENYPEFEKELNNNKEKSSEIISDINNKNKKLKNLKETEKTKEELINIKQNITKILKHSKKEMKILENKYENLLSQKEKVVAENSNILSQLNSKFTVDISRYEDELIKMNELIVSLINNYHRIFLSSLTEKCSPITILNKKDEYESILLSTQKELNLYSFPILFKCLYKNNKSYTNTISTQSMKKYSKKSQHMKALSQKILDKNYAELIKKASLLDTDNNEKKHPITSNVFLENLKIFIKDSLQKKEILLTKEKIEKLKSEELIEEYMKLILLIEEIEKYIDEEGQNLIKEKKTNKYYEQQINNYKIQIEKFGTCLDKEVSINNKNKILINSQKRIIEQLQNEKISKNFSKLNKFKDNCLKSQNKTNFFLKLNEYDNNNNLTTREKSRNIELSSVGGTYRLTDGNSNTFNSYRNRTRPITTEHRNIKVNCNTSRQYSNTGSVISPFVNKSHAKIKSQ